MQRENGASAKRSAPRSPKTHKKQRSGGSPPRGDAHPADVALEGGLGAASGDEALGAGARQPPQEGAGQTRPLGRAQGQAGVHETPQGSAGVEAFSRVMGEHVEQQREQARSGLLG